MNREENEGEARASTRQTGEEKKDPLADGEFGKPEERRCGGEGTS